MATIIYRWNMSHWKSGTLQATLRAYACSVHWPKCDQHGFHIPVLWLCVARLLADPHWIKSAHNVKPGNVRPRRVKWYAITGSLDMPAVQDRCGIVMPKSPITRSKCLKLNTKLNCRSNTLSRSFSCAFNRKVMNLSLRFAQ